MSFEFRFQASLKTYGLSNDFCFLFSQVLFFPRTKTLANRRLSENIVRNSPAGDYHLTALKTAEQRLTCPCQNNHNNTLHFVLANKRFGIMCNNSKQNYSF